MHGLGCLGLTTRRRRVSRSQRGGPYALRAPVECWQVCVVVDLLAVVAASVCSVAVEQSSMIA